MDEGRSETDQIRRSSRSVSANLLFINKLSDSIAEAAETQTWLEFALACKYIKKDKFDQLDEKYEHIFAMLHTMESKADSFCKKPS